MGYSTTKKINPKNYIYKKYKIDSIQFSQSNIYYASDIVAYKKMIVQVGDLLKANSKLAESELKKENKKIQKNKAY
jgi:hypothetical protein